MSVRPQTLKDGVIPLRISRIGQRQTDSGEMVPPTASTNRKAGANTCPRTVPGRTRANRALTIRLVSSSNCASHRFKG